MFRPLTLPYSGRCSKKDRYIGILHKFLNQCIDTKYSILKIIHDLKYILKIKTQVKIFVIDSDSNGYYVCTNSPFE